MTRSRRGLPAAGRLASLAHNLAQEARVEIRPCGKRASHVPVNRRAVLEQVGDELDVEGRHDGAASVVEKDETFALQHQQRLTDRQPGDTELGGETILRDLAAGHEPAVEDRRPDLVGDFHDHRFSLDRLHRSDIPSTSMNA